MENSQQRDTELPESGGSQDVDALSHLALLNRSKWAPEVEQFLNFGPRWHAPLWATFLSSWALWQGDLFNSAEEVGATASGGAIIEATSNPIFFCVGIVSAIVLVVDGFRRRSLKPKPSLASVGLTVVAVVIVVAVLVAWNLAIFAIGYDDFLFPWAPAAWIVTTMFFLGLRSWLGKLRNRALVAAVGRP